MISMGLRESGEIDTYRAGGVVWGPNVMAREVFPGLIR
jgi:hypothetical protein